jgi:hypothetical protein
MSLEGWKSLFEIGGVVLLGLTFVFGAGALITGNRINAIQSVELGDFKLKTAQAEAESAKAQLALKQYEDVIAKNVNPRRLDFKRFIELLIGKPKGTAEIWYEPGDEESHDFAGELYHALGSDGAGWTVSEPKSFPVKRGRDDPVRSAAASAGLAMAVKKGSNDFDTAEGALKNAINLGTGGWGVAGLGFTYEIPTLPDNHFVIVVGHHRANVPLVEFTPPRK